MRTAKLSWVLFVLALVLVGPVQAQDKQKEPKKADKEKTVVYEGKTVEQWIEALKDKDQEVRYSAARALGKIGPKAEKAVPALVRALKDKNEYVRQWAASALGKIGPKAEKAVPALTEALKDRWPGIRAQDAAVALGKIGPAAEKAVPALTEALKDEKVYVRKAAKEALAKIQQK